MKVKFWDRMILFFGALLTLVSGGVLLLVGLQIQGLMGDLPLWCRVLCIVCGALAILFGCYLLVFPWKNGKARKNEFVVQRTENGELRIAVKAIENLVQKCIDMHSEVQVISMDILNDRDGVMVDLNISLANNISIPLAVASLQKQIKQYLVASAGIEVSEVRVSVETAQVEADPATYLEEEEAAAAREEKPEKNEKNEKIEQAEKNEKSAEAAPARKLPLHQRLFGKQDQPATVPEPPKAEPEEAEQPPAQEDAPAAAPVSWGVSADAEPDEPMTLPSPDGEAPAEAALPQDTETEDDPDAK